MSMTFMAIATNKTYKKENIDELSFQFWLKKLKYVKEVLVEDAMKINFRDKGYIDIAFLPKGTLIFVSNPKIESIANIKRNSFNGKSGFFAADEISMTFQTVYYENYWLAIKHLEHNGEIHELITSKRVEFKIPYKDGFDLLMSSISDIIGQEFGQIPSNQIFYRYRITDEDIDFGIISDDKKEWIKNLKLMLFLEDIKAKKAKKLLNDTNTGN